METEVMLVQMHFNDTYKFEVVFSTGFKAFYHTPTPDIVLVRHFLEKSYGRDKIGSVTFIEKQDPIK